MTQEIQNTNALSIIDNVNLQQVSATMQKIAQFQAVVQQTLKQNHDFGIVPGTGSKPTLLKPGAEKILMLMGLSSEYEIVEKVQDYDKGFFAYTVRCMLTKNGQVITQGLGHCNSKEKKYTSEKQDLYMLGNTCLKMAKKRAQIDATLTVAALSEIFTQDLEDIDLSGNPTESSYKPKVDNPADILLTFGKYKGKKLGDVPLDYVEWLAKKANDEWLRDAAKKLLTSDMDESNIEFEAPEDAEFEEIFGDIPSQSPNESEKATDSQIKAIFTLAQNIGISNDEDLKAWISKIINKEIVNMKDITREEAGALIRELTKINDSQKK